MKAQRTRSRFKLDHAWLRRARRHFAQLCRRWVEVEKDPAKFRARLYIVAERAREHGLYAEATCVRTTMFGILSNWRRHDATMNWWPWMHADKRRASVADWSIKTTGIKREAERMRRQA